MHDTDRTWRVKRLEDGRARAKAAGRKHTGRKNMVQLYPNLVHVLQDLLSSPFANRVGRDGVSKSLSQIAAHLESSGITTKERSHIDLAGYKVVTCDGGKRLQKCMIGRTLAQADAAHANGARRGPNHPDVNGVDARQASSAISGSPRARP
jgi:hypothetical protein